MLKKPEQIENLTFDPSKSYSWEKETDFVLSGTDFGIILNTLRSSISTPEAQNIINQLKSLEVIEKLLSVSIQEGRVVEIENPEKQ